MSMRSFETAILSELRRQSGCSRVRQKDIMEWRVGVATDTDFVAQAGESAVFLPLNSVWVAYKAPEKKRELPVSSADAQSRIDGD